MTPSLDPFFGGYWRGGCTLSCCVVPIKDETDLEWDPGATDVDTEVDSDERLCGCCSLGRKGSLGIADEV